MYTIRGADQKEYGPVDASVIRQWIAQGRLNRDSMVRIEGSTEWTALSSRPEFDIAPQPPSGAPPPPPLRPDTLSPPKTSGLAVASLVLGILGLCTAIPAPVGLVLGIMALAKIKKTQPEIKGRGLAIAGICLSAVVLLLLLALVPLTLPALARAKASAQTTACLNNMKQLALAFHMYASDHDDKLPAAANWCDELSPTVGAPAVFKCPAAHANVRCSYAFNRRLAGLDVSKISPSTVLLFEATGDWNHSGGPRDIATHHRNIYTIAFADGSVRQMPAGQVSRLRWEP